MRFSFAILLLFVCGNLMAQSDSIRLVRAMQKLDTALLEKDSLVLAGLLSDDVSFGHSNGWVQTKADVWRDFSTGKLVYEQIANDSVTYASIGKRWATTRVNTQVTGRLNNREYKMRLHVMQVWKKKGKRWQLFARQSTKLN